MIKNYKILIACEESQVVTKAFRERGFEAFSCDVIPCSGGHPEWHLQANVMNIINDNWDMIIAHPPCTYLTVTGNKWMKEEFKNRFPFRQKQRQEAIEFFINIANAKCNYIAIENPVGVINTIYRKPDQYIHPYYFGDHHRKKTGLWLKGLPKLKPTNIVEPKLHICKNGKKEPTWHIETMYLSKFQERTKARSKTFPGIANAMSLQWGDFLLQQEKQIK